MITNNELFLNNDIQYKIKHVYETAIHEHASGHLYCTTSGIKRIAKIIGRNYDIMGKEKRANLRSDIISGYQAGYFKINNDY
jgi:hypothetical protein